MSPARRTIYFSQSLKTNLLSETIVSQAQPAFICSNFEYIWHVALVFGCFFSDFKHVHDEWNTLIP